MRTVYTIIDKQGREIKATQTDEKLEIIMCFFPEELLTIEDICTIMRWNVIEKVDYEKPKIIPMRGKD